MSRIGLSGHLKFPEMEVEDLELQEVHNDSLSLDGMSLFSESVT